MEKERSLHFESRDISLVLLVNGKGSPAEQMDRDRQISEWMGASSSMLLRLYRISEGATVGRTWQGRIPDSWKIPPCAVSIRPTGGGAVLHGRDLCLSLFIPRRLIASSDRNWSAFYQVFHSWILSFLIQLGQIPVMNLRCHSASSERTPTESAHESLCFRDPVPGDLMVDGSKILGGALAITRKGVLYQGSLHLPGMDPDVLSCLFEEWYCSEGKRTIRRIILMKGRDFEPSEPLCSNRAVGEFLPSV